MEEEQDIFNFAEMTKDNPQIKAIYKAIWIKVLKGVEVDGKLTKKYICTRCLKTLKKDA